MKAAIVYVSVHHIVYSARKGKWLVKRYYIHGIHITSYNLSSVYLKIKRAIYSAIVIIYVHKEVINIGDASQLFINPQFS